MYNRRCEKSNKKTAKGIAWVLLLALGLLSALPALGQGQGQGQGFAVEVNSDVYFVIHNEEFDRLYHWDGSGESPKMLQQSLDIDQLAAIDGVCYCFSSGAGGESLDLVAYTAGKAHLVFSMEGRGGEGNLFSYAGKLYALIDSRLSQIDPETGEIEFLSDIEMNEFTFYDDRLFFIATPDDGKVSYMQREGDTSPGALYELDLSTGQPSLILDLHLAGLKIHAGYMYFQNFDDQYIAPNEEGDGGWSQGRLYRSKLDGQGLTPLDLEYAWDYFPTDSGLVVYTAGNISRGDLSGEAVVQLMVPKPYSSVALWGDALLVFEPGPGKLMKLSLDGSEPELLWQGSLEDNASTLPIATIATDDYIFPDSDSRRLTQGEVEAIDSDLWALARNEIYARHGYKFSNAQYADYFGQKDWYLAGGFSKSSLNSIEWHNVDLIRKLEKQHQGNLTLQKGDYIFPQSSKEILTQEQIDEIDASLLPYARNEIYARHGYEFKKAKYARYFRKKSWYKPGGFSASDLSTIEQRNIVLIRKTEERQTEVELESEYLLPESSQAKLTEERIRQLDPEWWPYARNEIYARHGYKFQNSKYAEYFASKPWYQAGGFSENKFSEIELYNIKLLKELEQQG